VRVRARARARVRVRRHTVPSAVSSRVRECTAREAPESPRGLGLVLG
jgi:hypothetical protein